MTAKIDPILDCAMRDESVRGLTKAECGARRLCWVCGAELPERRLFWCSDACVRTWSSNHEWSAASAERIRIDEARCQRCGATALDVFVCDTDGQPWPCETVVAYDRAWAEYRAGGPLPERQGHAHWKRLDRAASVLLEVNHKVPRNGAGYAQGCWHHLGELETLCHACHVAETNRQARERRDADA